MLPFASAHRDMGPRHRRRYLTVAPWIWGSRAMMQAVDPDEEKALLQIGAALDIADKWQQTFTGNPDGHKAKPGSELASDDLLSHPYMFSPVPWAALTAAVSHLCVLRDSLFLHTGPDRVQARIHTHGQLTLVRGALENSSMAVWLLQDDSSIERITRRIQCEWDEIRQLETVRSEIGTPSAKTLAQREVELVALLQKVGAEPSRLKKRPGYGEIVKAAGASQPAGAKTAFVIWKACSSVAHGEMRGALAYLRPAVKESEIPGRVVGHITGHIELLSVGCLTAIATTGAAFSLYNRRAEYGNPVM